MRVLVTGGAGFQGSNLCRALLDRGDRVTIYNTWSERSAENLKRFGLQEATVVWGSITDPNGVDKVVRDHDLVCHLAANIHVDESIDDPQSFTTTNVLGTYNVAESCRKQRVPLLHVSSCEVYGGCPFCPDVSRCQRDHLISEACPLKPQSPYAGSKAGAESLVYAHGITYGMPVLIVRPGNVYGPGQRFGSRGAVIPIFVQKAMRNQQITIYGNGSQGRDFVYVADLIRAYLLLADRFLAGEPVGRVVNIGTGRAVNVRQIAATVVEETASASQVVHGPARPGEVSSFRLDSSRLYGLGFRFQFSFDEGVRQYVSWCRRYEHGCLPV